VITITERSDAVSVLLEPNRSSSWHQTRQIILGFSAFLLTIGMGWLIAGVWMILPFVLIDILLVSYFFYRVCEYTYQKQLIQIYPDKIQCQQGIRIASKPLILKRPCYIVCDKKISRHHLPAYSLSDDTVTISIGDFLNKEDLSELYQALTDNGLFPLDKQWWQESNKKDIDVDIDPDKR
jgi:uncharacterized membrane protein